MPWDQYFWAGAILAPLFVLLWTFLGREGLSGWADFAWAVAIGVTAISFAALGTGWMPRRIAVAGLAAFWSIRLASHLGTRLAGEGEDGRYKAMADDLGTNFRKFMLGFYLLQALMAWLFSMPFFALAQVQAEAFQVNEYIGLALWISCFLGVYIADRQLARFKAQSDSSGKTCRVGLWSWSRHPNYFFEWLVWTAYPIMAIGTDAFWWTLGGAALLFIMVRFVSGVPYTEAQAVRSRGDDYRKYQNEVSAFFPLPPSTQ